MRASLFCILRKDILIPHAGNLCTTADFPGFICGLTASLWNNTLICLSVCDTQRRFDTYVYIFLKKSTLTKIIIQMPQRSDFNCSFLLTILFVCWSCAIDCLTLPQRNQLLFISFKKSFDPTRLLLFTTKLQQFFYENNTNFAT